MKVFYAICRMRHIVDFAWIRASLAAKKFVDEKPYAPSHAPFEKMYNVTITEVMAKPSRRTLFKVCCMKILIREFRYLKYLKTSFFSQDINFHITQGIVGEKRQELMSLIRCAGGSAELVRSWAIRDTLSKYPKKNVLITCDKDFELAEQHLRGARRPHVISKKR
jgi:hypothetical protein